MIPLLVPEISPSGFFVTEEELRIIVVGESGDLGPVKTVVTISKILFIKRTCVLRNHTQIFLVYTITSCDEFCSKVHDRVHLWQEREGW